MPAVRKSTPCMCHTQDHSSMVLEHKAVVAELQQCQQQLNEVAASSKASSATSEIYTRVSRRLQAYTHVTVWVCRF